MGVVEKLAWLVERQVKGVHWPWIFGSLLILLILRAMANRCVAKEDERKKTFGLLLLRVEGVLAIVWYLTLIFDITLFQEGKAAGEVVLQPFDPDSWLAAAEPFGFHERRLFHGALNALLFLPLGVLLQSAIPQSWRSKKRDLLLIVCTLGFGCLIELLQYGLQIGNVISDVPIFRLLGALLGWRLIQCLVLKRLNANC